MRLIQPFLLAAAFLASTACNDSSQLVAGKKSDAKEQDDEKDEADQPVPVSGAYLSCDWLEPETNDSILIGCAAMNSDGQAFDRTNRNFSLSLYNDDGSSAPLTAADASEDSPWHKLARLPGSHKGTGYLKMATKKSGIFEGSLRLNTVEIGSNVSVGNQLEGEPIPLVISDGLALQTITSNLQWDAGAAGLALSLVNAKDYCDAGGKLRSEMSSSSSVAVAIADGLLNAATTNTTSTIADISIALKSDTCFSRFKERNSSGKEFAHQNSDGSCFLLRSGNKIHVISVPKAANPDMTLENLRKFAGKKQCVN